MSRRLTKDDENVIPAQAGIQNAGRDLDSHFRGNDGYLEGFSGKVLQLALIIGILSSMAYAADVTPSPHSSPQRGEEVIREGIKIPDVVAVVNGTNITKQDLERRMAQSRSMNPERFDAMGLEERKKAMIRTIDNIVMREVIYQEAVRRGIVVTDKEVEMGLDDLKRQFPSEEAFEKSLADASITIPAWKEETRKNMMEMKLEELMTAKLKISDWKRGLLTNAKVWKWSPEQTK